MLRRSNSSERDDVCPVSTVGERHHSSPTVMTVHMQWQHHPNTVACRFDHCMCYFIFILFFKSMCHIVNVVCRWRRRLEATKQRERQMGCVHNKTSIALRADCVQLKVAWCS